MNFTFFSPQADSLQTGLAKQLKRLDELLVEHQLAFMEKDWEKGIERFEQVYELRRHHLKFMESRLLPLFELYHPKPPEGARPLYFLREKKQILKTMDGYVHLFGRLFLAGKIETIDLVRLFDEYMYLKDLLDHHDAREKGFLFKLLDKNLSIPERKVLLDDYCKELSRFDGRWNNEF